MQQMVDLSSNFFALFALPVSFDIDMTQLAARYRALQSTVHPDKFVNAGEAERRLSMQMAVRVNEGFHILKDPLARARYLLELQNIELNEQDIAFDNVFLMEQMELRECLSEVRASADPQQRLQQVMQDIAVRSRSLMASLAEQLQKGDAETLQQAKDLIHKLQFFRRLEEEADALDEELAEG
jgi:molecular chaperone HscB